MSLNPDLPVAGARWRIREDEAGPCPADLRTRLVEGIPALLPGCVHQALRREGLIPDPFYGKNAETVGWIEELHWILEMEISSPPTEDTAQLVLDGVDTYATVFLNNAQIGSTENAFLRYTIPVPSQLAEGANRLRFEFQPIREAVGPQEKEYNVAFFYPARVHVRRMQCTFGWDWVHQLITFGLSQVPRLVSRPEVVFPGVLTIGLEGGTARLQARWDGAPLERSCEVQIRIDAPDGRLVLTRVVPLEEGLAEFEIPEAELWHPAGSGAQPLYRAFFLPVRDGQPAGDEISVPFGIRTTELLLAFDQEGSVEERMTAELAAQLKTPLIRGREFGFRINGTDVFAVGGNWVPCDPFPGPETEVRKQRILRQFAACGGNALRIWGGGIYETPAFYDACAELGIMVLQDFMMACGDYPADDQRFLDKLEPEVNQVVKRLRGHTAIVHWYGDNENAMSDGEVAPGKAWFEIAEKIVRPALARHDRARSFTPSSPFFGTPSTNALQGDSHLSVFFTEDREFLLSDMQDYKVQLDRTIGRFGSECALFGAPDVESLVRFMPEDRLDDSDLWEFHTKDNPSHPPGVDFTLFQSLEICASRILGPFQDRQDRLNKLAYVHYEAVRLVIEAARRKQPFCRGILFWMLNDCWPSSGWSLIDYYVRPKAASYGLRHATQPIHPSFRPSAGKVEAWISNNSPRSAVRTCTLAFETWDGARTTLGTLETDITPGTSSCLCDVDLTSVADPQSGVFLLETEAGESGWYFHGMPFRMNPPAATLEVAAVAESDGSITCRVTADSYARVVTLRGNAVAEENYFELRAGETKLVKLRWPGDLAASPLFFKPWNGPAIPVNPEPVARP